MKTKWIKVAVMASVTLFVACTQENAIVNGVEEPTTRAEATYGKTNVIEPTTLDLLKTYIDKVKFVGKDAPSYTLTPYKYEGDTVLYVANYEKGWDILSTDERTPIVLVSSETGTYNEDELPESVKTYIESIAEEVAVLKQTENVDLVQDEEWAAIHKQNEKASTRSNPELGIGYWYLLGTEIIGVSSTDSINHLVTTHWHQEAPFNEYVPYDNGVHAVVGCAPVAVGQYLYFLYEKDGMSWQIPTYGRYWQPLNTYFFSQMQYAMNNLGKVESSANSSNTAIFLGYLGKMMNTSFSASSSSTTTANMLSVLNGYLTTNYSEYDMNSSYVINSLQSGYPVLTKAYKNSNNTGGHAFIIDKYNITTTQYHFYYGWVGEDSEGNPTNEFDELGHPLDFTYYMDEDYYQDDTTISMNWGYAYDNSSTYWKKYDDLKFHFYDTNWIVGNFNGKYNRKIYH